MLDRPFGDLGPVRRVRWLALGISWTCEFANDYRTTPGAEQLIAELQLAACALAGRDLGVVPCDIIIKVEVSPTSSELELTYPSDDVPAFRITLPRTDRSIEQVVGIVSVFGDIIDACSALSGEALMQTFDRSVLDPIFVGRPYAELYREFVPGDLFAEATRQKASPLDPEREFTSRAGERVGWFDGRGPTYKEEEAKFDIEHRYRCLQPSLHFTLKRLVSDPRTRLRLQRMRDKGLKDWEILSILGNIAINARMGQRGGLPPNELRELGKSLASRPETPDTALDPALFTDEQIELHSTMYFAAFLNGRMLKTPTPLNSKGLEKFLVARYRLREDDVAHSDLFNWSDPDNDDGATSGSLRGESA